MLDFQDSGRLTAEQHRQTSCVEASGMAAHVDRSANGLLILQPVFR